MGEGEGGGDVWDGVEAAEAAVHSAKVLAAYARSFGAGVLHLTGSGDGKPVWVTAAVFGPENSERMIAFLKELQGEGAGKEPPVEDDVADPGEIDVLESLNEAVDDPDSWDLPGLIADAVSEIKSLRADIASQAEIVGRAYDLVEAHLDDPTGTDIAIFVKRLREACPPPEDGGPGRRAKEVRR